MKYLIMAGGALLNPLALNVRLTKYDKIIAVDSGFDHCVALDLEPDVLVGDMDSIASYEREQLGDIDIIEANPEKDDTDLKLAVNHAIEQGATAITFAGATGGRIDHFLNNLSIMEYTYHKGMTCEMLDEVNRITILEGEKSYTNISKYVSLIPITDTITVSGQNIKYPMDKLVVHKDNIISVSNEATGDIFVLNVIEGKAFVIQAD